MREIKELCRAVAEADAWIDDLAQRLGWHDRRKTYAAFIGALHGLRDALPRDEVVYLGAQLPSLLRGLYYEGWRPGAHRAAQSLEALCARIHEAVERDPGIDPEAAARAVLALLAARLPASEIEDVIAATPRRSTPFGHPDRLEQFDVAIDFAKKATPMKIFLCGDVMTGRGIDQALPYPCSPMLHEGYVESAVDYLRLAEEANGLVPRPVDFAYVWGAALDEWRSARPHARIVNLETSITRNEAFEPKGINYRMSPENAPCLTAAAVDCCVLANNHVLDWGRAGLIDTLDALKRMGVKTAGAGRNLAEAKAPAIVEIPDEGRLIVIALASETSGVPRHWAADAAGAGVNLLSSLSETAVRSIADELAEIRRPRDVVVVSIHWGPNWGYPIPKDQRRFAHALIEEADVSIVHGHSSHHPKAIEIREDRLILYGCGDFLNDYEGIAGYEEFRGDLSLMYFADVDPADGRLRSLDMTPLKIRRLQLSQPSTGDVDWLLRTLDRESAPFGTRVKPAPGGRLAIS